MGTWCWCAGVALIHWGGPPPRERVRTFKTTTGVEGATPVRPVEREIGDLAQTFGGKVAGLMILEDCGGHALPPFNRRFMPLGDNREFHRI